MYTIYWASTGEILRTSQTSDPALGEAAIEGEFSATTHFVKAKAAIEIPPSPQDGFVFDYLLERWVPVAGRDTRAVVAKRNKLLTESDWTQMPDASPPNKVGWATYRQELRDLTAQAGYPLRFIWPTPPSTS